MALKISDCDRILDASKQQGAKICVVHNNLFHAPLLKAKALLAEGAIGDFVGMRIFLSTPRWDMIDLERHWYHRLQGGVIGETGPHIAYMTLAFAGDAQGVEVFAQNRLGHPWAPHDEFRIEMDCEKGSSSATLSYTRNCWGANVDIYGTEEALHVDLHQMSLTRHKLRSLKYIPVSKLSLSIIAQTSKGFASNVGKALMGRQKFDTISSRDRELARRRFGFGENDIVLFFMGSLYDFSGIKEIGLEMAKDRWRNSPLKLLIVGSGDSWADTNRAIEENGVQEKVVIEGWRPYAEIPALVMTSDICILPALKNEVMMNIVPIKMYEYMAARKPVIATSLPGLMKEFGTTNGVSYINRSEEALSVALELSKDRRMADEGRKARMFVEKSDWKSITQTFEVLLQNLSKRSPATGQG